MNVMKPDRHGSSLSLNATIPGKEIPTEASTSRGTSLTDDIEKNLPPPSIEFTKDDEEFGPSCFGLAIWYACRIANILAVTMCLALLISVVIARPLIGTFDDATPGCFMCWNNEVLFELIGLCLGIIAIVGTTRRHLNACMIAVPSMFYFSIVFLPIGSEGELGDWFVIVLRVGSGIIATLHWMLLLVSPYPVAGIDRRSIISLRDNPATKKDTSFTEGDLSKSDIFQIKQAAAAMGPLSWYI